MTTDGARRMVVIGVGNPWRRDDGAGWAVLDAIGTRLAGRADLTRCGGEPTSLIDAWGNAELAVVVDALQTGSPAGTVHRLDLGADHRIPVRHSSSSHGLGLDDAVHLGRALRRLPRQLVVVGVEGEEFGQGSGLRPAVAEAIGPAAEVVIAAVNSMV